VKFKLFLGRIFRGFMMMRVK